MAFPALLDTCVLYPAYLRDTLLRLASAGTYRPLWSDGILDELRRNVIARGIPEDKADRRIRQMRRAFPDATVRGHEPMIEGMTNDPKDRHVLAAAVRGGADDFLLDQLDLHPGATLGALERQAASYRREPTTVIGVLGLLERTGVPRFAAEVRRHLR